MLIQHTMPAEYDSWVSYILCNDCEEKSFSKFHFMYHKCAGCGSYNTKVLKSMEGSEVGEGVYVQRPGKPCLGEVKEGESGGNGEEEGEEEMVE